MANSANLPAPYAGINVKTPIAVLKSPYCENLINFNTTDAGIQLRHGDSLWTAKLQNDPGVDETFLSFVKYGDKKLFYTADMTSGNNKYFDITTSTPSLAHTSATAISGEIFTLYFNKRVFTFGTTSSVGDYFDGTSWGAWAYTFSTIAPIGGCAYKNRAYFIGRDSATFGYGPLDGVSGAVTEKALAGVLLEQSFLAVIAPVTIVNSGSVATLLAYVFFSGEVLFYSGSYPDSDSWSLAGRGKIGSPLNYNCSIDYQGDALIMTRIGLVSLRDVFLSGGQQATTKTVSEGIDPVWIELVNGIIEGGAPYYDAATGRLSYVRGDWWTSKNRIVIAFPADLTSGGIVTAGGTFFVFDTLRQAWTIHEISTSRLLYGLIEFQDSLFINGTVGATAVNYQTILKKEGASDFQDAYNNVIKENYSYTFLSAPIPFPKTAVYETTGIEPILESDLYAETNWVLVSDFGKQVSGNQTVDALTTAPQKPLANVGMQNITYVQVKMSGTTAAGKTVGLDLYSYNVWYDAGERASR